MALNKSRLISLLIVCFVFLRQGRYGIRRVGAQAQSDVTLYAVTQNNETRESTVWRVSIQSGQAQPVYTLKATSQLIPETAFSQHELAAMKIHADKGELPPEVRVISQHMQRVWALDTTRILIELTNDLCNRTYMNLCFGYFELIIVDSTRPNEPRSLLKIDYHGEVFATWGCMLPSSTSVVIEKLLLNPKQDRLAVTLRPAWNCSTKPMATDTLVVDYSSRPVRLLEMPMTFGLSWSPDGNWLAYYAVGNCPLPGCDISVNLAFLPTGGAGTLVSNTRPPIAMITLIPGFFVLPTAWANNGTLLYEWYAGLEQDPLLVSYRLDTNNRSETVLTTALLQGSLYYFAPNLTILNTQDTFAIFASPQQKTFKPLKSRKLAAQIFYNSKYPGLVLVSEQVGCLDQILAIRPAAPDETSIRLSTFLPKNECAVFVSPHW